jgi:DNA polymerase III sliding clamp (beta) subunit (PCNA family)
MSKNSAVFFSVEVERDVIVKALGQVIIRIADPGSPVLIQDSHADDALFVLMPLRA